MLDQAINECFISKKLNMKVLIGCEESQAVCIEFRKRGHEAYSCDVQECSGGHPEWHLQMDIFEAIEKIKPELFIGHPPCTYISNAGNAFFSINKYGIVAINRWMERIKAVEFFFKLFNCNIEKICLENPVGFLNGELGIKPDQIIEPFYFGDNDRKRTCLWLKGLPKLIHTKQDNLFFEGTHLPPPCPLSIDSTGKKRYFTDAKNSSQKSRSKTFTGIAKAMAEQWG